MSSDGSMEELDSLPLCEQPEWKDLEPLDIDDGRKVVAIQYTERHRQALGYFRAVMDKGEKSARALALTEEMISLNQADYTAWQWRWACLCALEYDLTQEYAFTDGIMQNTGKNYQLWNHRRKCALSLGAHAAERELCVAAQALEDDEKNYHAWAHRQAIVRAFGGHLWTSELAYVEQMIARDVRNNSAWNQRAFVLQHKLSVEMEEWEIMAPEQQGSQPSPLRVLVAKELEYVATQVAIAPRNESAWNYLQGLFSLPGLSPHAMARHEEVYAICFKALRTCPNSGPALGTLSLYYLHLAHLAATPLASLGAAHPAPSGSLELEAIMAQEQAATSAAGVTSAAAAGGAETATEWAAAQTHQQQQQQVSNGAGSGVASATVCDDENRSGGVPAGATSTSTVGGPQGSATAAAARLAVVKCTQSVVTLLNHLMQVDPIRSMFWNHRFHEIEALCTASGINTNEVLVS